MNRSPFAPSAAAAARFPSGWRARLARDPIPTLFARALPLSARIRRELIDDDEAPRGAEVLAFADVKAFLKKQGAKGDFPAKPLEKSLGSEKFASVIATVRALERMAELGLGSGEKAVTLAAELVLATQAKDGGIAALAIGETKVDKAKLPGGALSGVGVGGTMSRGVGYRATCGTGLQFSIAVAASRRGLGLAGCAVRFVGAPVESSDHRDGPAGVRRVAIAALIARGAPSG